jgi:hypothetical protein
MLRYLKRELKIDPKAWSDQIQALITSLVDKPATGEIRLKPAYH